MVLLVSNQQEREGRKNWEVFIGVCLDLHTDGQYVSEWIEVCKKYNIVTKWLDSKDLFQFDTVC